MESTKAWQARGKDGLVEFDGRELTIKRRHGREMLKGLLLGSFRSDVRLTPDQIQGIRIRRGHFMVEAPGAIKWSGKRQPRDPGRPLRVAFRGSQLADFEALREAVLAAATRPLHAPPAGYPGGSPRG